MSRAISIRKAAQYKREVVHRFREAMPETQIHPGLHVRGRDENPDVDCPVFWLEIKQGQQPNVRAALKQATLFASEGRIPVAVISDDGDEAFVALSLEDFLKLVAEWWRGINQ